MTRYFMTFDEEEIRQITRLLHKVSANASSDAYSPAEKRLMQRMLDNREVILSLLYAISKDAIAVNQRGRDKILNLIRGVERICSS